ncbi:MAG: HpcH/HpaI aldolase family protein [Pseudomonadota bacterium]
MAGEPVFGTFVFLPDPGVVEIMALAGMDFVIIDLEHSPKNWETVENMVRAAEARGLSVLIRVSENNEKGILQALELGAEGVVVPFVQTADDARKAGAAMKYAPAGTRGTCTLTRVAAYGGLRAGFLDHARRLNEKTLFVAQVEDKVAVDNIASIVAAEPGPDVIMIGRSDLASSLGRPGQVNDPAVLEATDWIIRAVATGGDRTRCFGIGVYGPAEAAAWLRKGCRFFFFSSDGLILLNAAKGAREAFRQAVAESAKSGSKVTAA